MRHSLYVALPHGSYTTNGCLTRIAGLIGTSPACMTNSVTIRTNRSYTSGCATGR